MHYRCSSCDREEPLGTSQWRCPCGGPWNLAGDRPPLSPDDWASRPAGVWRYAQALPFPAEGKGVTPLTLGEGGTPLIPIDPARGDLLVKLEYVMPTLSFKDRGATVLLTHAGTLGVRQVIVDSSGNAGTAIAAYGARAGMSVEVFVPSSTATRKVRQIEWYGAQVRVVSGSRQAAADAAAEAVDDGRGFYASHVFNPWFLEGTQTFAFEIWEQLGRRAPDVLILPVGNGTLVLGAGQGFHRLAGQGLIKSVPRIIGVQAEACAPLAVAWREGRRSPVAVDPVPTAAEGVAVARPRRGAQVLAAVASTGGQVVAVSEEETAGARVELARRGIFVEPTAAITWAAARQVAFDGTAVIALGGAGLKSD